MTRASFLLVLAPFVICTGAQAGHAANPIAKQGTPDLARIVQERLQAVQGRGLAEILRSADGLASAADDIEEGRLDALLDRELERSGTGPEARLFLVAARLSGDDPDLALMADALVPLIDDADDELARGAVAMLGEPSFRALEADASERVFTALRGAMGDERRAAEVRLEAAVALHNLGRGPESRDARRAVMAYLDSSDAELRGQGALALARIGDVETGRRELERLALRPTAEGVLAESYLKNEDQRRFWDRKHKSLEESYREKLEGSNLNGLGELEIIEKVMRMIELQSLEGGAFSRERLIDAALNGMLHALDAHSSYMPPDTFKDFDQDVLQAEYGGIGAYVNADPDDGLFTITRPIYSGPAYKAGLQSDDKIVRIDEWPTVLPAGGSHPTDDIIKRLKGKPGTTVKLYIWRHGMDFELIERPSEDMAVEVERARITVPPVHGEMLPGKIGLVELTQFSRPASQELERKLREFKDQGMRAVVLDLRNNSGGLLQEARNVSNLFLPKGQLVVTTESRSGEPEKLYTRVDPLIPADMPVVVLINRFSASASEIVSGALRELGRGVLVGQRSFGKGSVQTLLPVTGMQDDDYRDENKNGRFDPWEALTRDFNGNGEFDYAPRVRLTIARYLLPGNVSIHRTLDEDGNIVNEGGVQPDHTVQQRRWDYWKVREIKRLNDERAIREWVEPRWPAERETFLRLADGDRGDPDLYPDFAALYDSLQTSLPTDDVRFLLRREVRRRAQDERGAAYPQGDYEEDPQLQKALQLALEDLGQSFLDVPEYASTFDDLGEVEALDASLAQMSDARRSDLRQALALITRARTSDQVPDEVLAELQELLEHLDK